MKNTTINSTEHTSLTHQTYRVLYNMIIQGDLEPGIKLKIDSLRKDLGVGASPVREALSLLTSDHLVERMDQRGFKVSELSAEGFSDLLKTRCWLEELALRESIKANDDLWEEELIIAHHRLKRESRFLENNTPNPDWEIRHKAFHMALLSACGSNILIKMCDQLYDQNIRYRNAAKDVSYPKRDSASEHDQIVEYVIDNNVDAAVDELVSHYKTTGNYLAFNFSDEKVMNA